MIESVCRYIAILALIVRIGASFHASRAVRKQAGGPGASAQTSSSRGLRSAWVLFANIWVVIALAFWLVALVQERLSWDAF